MKIGILSDTHDQMPLIKKAVEIFNKENVDMVIHCGDWVSPFALIPLRKLECPIRAVFGNNDGDKFRHVLVAQRLKLNIEQEERFMSLDIDGKKAAVFHGDYDEMIEAMAKSGMYDVIFCGHTHTLRNERINSTLVVNPGGLIHIGKSKEKPTVAIYDRTKDSVEHVLV
ncbi:metallophosphoesterase [Spirochaetota bacterium]